jgi:hypothetical protein
MHPWGMVSTARYFVDKSDDSQVPKAGSPVEELMNRVFRGMEATTGIELYRQFTRMICEFLRYASRKT